MIPEEMIDVIDENNNILFTCARSEVEEKKHLARFVHVFVKDSQRNMILQQRHHTKKSRPNLLEACGGYVTSGYSFEYTAQKELEEEFGLKLPVQELYDVWGPWGLCKVFEATYDGDLNNLVLEKDSVAHVFKLPENVIYKMIRKTPFVFNRGFVQTFMHYWRGKFGFKNLQTCDENGIFLGGCSWEDMEDNSPICATAHVILENDNGAILIQKRGPNLGAHPNTLCVSAAGHVDEGETECVAAVREAHEELGVNTQLQKIDKFYIEHETEGFLKREFVHLYTGKISGDISLEREEVADAYWVEKNELKWLLEKMPTLFNPVAYKDFNIFLQHKEG